MAFVFAPPLLLVLWPSLRVGGHVGGGGGAAAAFVGDDTAEVFREEGLKVEEYAQNSLLCRPSSSNCSSPKNSIR